MAKPGDSEQFTKNHRAPESHQQPPGQIHPHPSKPPPRLLNINRGKLSHRHMTILDSDTQSTLYSVDGNSGSFLSSKPHIHITAAASQIGTITFRTFTRHLDLSIHNRALTLDSAGWFSNNYSFHSPTRSGEILTWAREIVFGSMVLHDSRGEWIAKFDRSPLAMGKVGTLEVHETQVTASLLDEVVVTGIALVLLARRRAMASNSGVLVT